MVIFLLDFSSFFLSLLSVIVTLLVSLPVFPKIFSDQTLFSQFLFVFGLFLAFLLFLIRYLLKSYVIHLKSRILIFFSFFAFFVLLETLYVLHPSFSLATKQLTLINIDVLLPGLSWVALFFLLVIFVTNPFVQKFKKFLFPFLLALSVFSFLSYLYFFFSLPASHPSLPVSWQIAVGELSQSPIMGTGPGLFLQAFNKFRPASLNISPFWQFKFNNSGSEFLEILTTTGLLGFGSYLLFLFFVLRSSLWPIQNLLKKDSEVTEFIPSKVEGFPRMTVSLLLVLCLLSYVLSGLFSLFFCH